MSYIYSAYFFKLSKFDFLILILIMAMLFYTISLANQLFYTQQNTLTEIDNKIPKHYLKMHNSVKTGYPFIKLCNCIIK